MGATSGDVEAGFAKLQGEDFEYYMQTYSIILGRNSKKSTVDVDLSSLGGGMNISRHHARIFYDFARRRFALEVLGKNGCFVEGVLHLPGNPPVKLDSQDLLQIGDKEFYFLLPVRSILGGPVGARGYAAAAGAGAGAVVAAPVAAGHYGNYHIAAAAMGSGKKGRGREYYEEYEEDDGDDDNNGIGGSSGKKVRREGFDGYSYGAGGSGEKKADGRSRVDRDADNHQLLQLEEKDVVSTVATALSDICGPGEWMPMEKLHAVLLEKYANVWHHSRVRRYLTSEDWPGPESKGKPWKGIARDSYRAARNKEIQLSKEFLRGVFYSDDLGSRDKIADCQLFY
nr:fha domain-containing protein fha2 [Quercus suber]